MLAAGGIHTFGSFLGFFLAILIAGACALIAEKKGRSVGGWFLGGLIFTLIALLIIALIPSKR